MRAGAGGEIRKCKGSPSTSSGQPFASLKMTRLAILIQKRNWYDTFTKN
jgi:hypothetical protein